MKKISKFLSFILTLLLIVGNLPVITQATEDTVIDTFYLTVNTEAWTSYAIGYPEGIATAQLSMGVATGEEAKYSVRTNSSCLGVKTTDGYYQTFTSDNIINNTTEYKYKFVIQPENGYTLDSNPENINVYLNGTLAVVEEISFLSNGLYNLYIDIVNDPAPRPDIIYIDNIELDFSKPSPGNTASTDVTTNFPTCYTVSSVTWSCAENSAFKVGDVFGYNSTYTQTMTLTPNTGYEFLVDADTSEYIGRYYLNYYGDDYSFIMDGKNLVVTNTFKIPMLENDIYLDIDYANWTKFNLGLDAYEAQEQFFDEIASVPDEYSSKYSINLSNSYLMSLKDGVHSVIAGTLSNEYDYYVKFTIWPNSSITFNSNPSNMNIYINGVKKTYDLDYNTYWGCYTFEVPIAPFLEANITADKTTVNKGDKVTITANATGGTAPYTYKYAILNVDNGKWSVLKDFSNASSFTYKLDYPGKKQFAVTVKDSNGKTVATNRIDVTVKNPVVPLAATLKSNGSISDVTVNKGGNIKLDVSATGGSGTYAYKFAVLNVDNGKWSVLKDFSNTNSFTYKLDYPGKKQFAVTVKDSNGTTVATNRINVTVTNSTAPLSATLKSNGSTSAVTINKGGSIKLDIAATGGSGTYTYKFAVLNVDNGKWSVLKDFSNTNSFTYKLDYPGKKQFAVTVKDSKGATVATNRIDVTVTNTTTPSVTLKANGSTESITAKVNDSINLVATAIGGTAPYTYKFAVYNVDYNSWYILKDYSESSSFNVKLSSAGKKEFVVSVKDSKGTIISSKRILVTATN